MIRVNKDWIVDVDPLNYTPMRDMHRMRKAKHGDGMEPDYKGGYGYYTSLKGAIRAIAQAEYRNALAGRETALDEAIKMMDETVTRFEKILEGIRE